MDNAPGKSLTASYITCILAVICKEDKELTLYDLKASKAKQS